MSDYIPAGIIVEILARLPVKSILRYTIVCKEWYSIITNPNFITTHLKRFGETTDQILLNVSDNPSHDHQGHYCLLPDNDQFGKSCTDLVFPFKTKNDEYLGFLGSFNGLICLYKCNKYLSRGAKNVIIWNPCIRRSVTLTLPPRIGHPSVLGFGFDLLKNVFKVVNFVEENLTKIMVYEQGRREEWREIVCTLPDPTQYCVLFTQVFLHGSLHCLALVPPKFNVDFHNVIIALEMSDEVFTEIALPPVVADLAPVSLEVTRLKDSLAVLSGIDPGSEICSVWLMKEYGVSDSWTNLYTIELLKLGCPMPMATALGFRENGEILLMSATREVISYDLETEACTNSRICGGGLMKVENFTESLMLLEEGEKYES